MRRHLRWSSLILITAVSAATAPLAGATSAVVRDVQALTVGTPAPGTCNEPDIPDIETDNRIAVNPTDPANIVAVWTQGDRGDEFTGSFTSFLATAVGVSHDGGRTWRQLLVPGHSGCSLGPPGSFAYDPAVTFDASGTLYVGSLNFDGDNVTERVLVSRSFDGGDTWELTPTVIDSDNEGPGTDPRLDFSGGVINHELWLTSDPAAPGRAYALWSRHDNRCIPQPTCFDPFGTYRYWPARLSKTTNGGASWTPARDIYQPPQLLLPFGHQLRVLPGGGLVDVFHECDARDRQPDEGTAPLCSFVYRNQLRAIHSADGGLTWSDPVVIARGKNACGRSPWDAETSTGIHAQPGASLDVGSDGGAYAAWHAIRCNNGETSRIMFSKSLDGGATWSNASAINENAAQGFGVSLAVGASGTIGVTYYDFRRDVPGDDELTTDVWFAHSHNRGASWNERRVVGPFDTRKSWFANSEYALADYFGLARLVNGFAASLIQVSPRELEPPTDVYFANIAVP